MLVSQPPTRCDILLTSHCQVQGVHHCNSHLCNVTVMQIESISLLNQLAIGLEHTCRFNGNVIGGVRYYYQKSPASVTFFSLCNNEPKSKLLLLSCNNHEGKAPFHFFHYVGHQSTAHAGQPQIVALKQFRSIQKTKIICLQNNAYIKGM